MRAHDQGARLLPDSPVLDDAAFDAAAGRDDPTGAPAGSPQPVDATTEQLR